MLLNNEIKLNPKVPVGNLQDKWDHHKNNLKLVNPSTKKKFTIIVVGTGLAGASASASLAELGYNVKTFCIHDSPRRAHSIAAQGGINAAKNYPNDGDTVWRLFYDTMKGGDFRSREASVYRLAQVSNSIIDQCVAQGVPFAREYGGLLANRSFGGAQVSRTFYARGQTGQQLLLGAYSAMMRQVNLGKVNLLNRREMLDLVIVDGKAKGIIARNLVTGGIERYAADAVLVCTGGYGNAYYLSSNAKNSNATAIWRCHKRGALFANPGFVQIHPTCVPVSGKYQSKLTLMSESLRNDGRVWVSKKEDDNRHPNDIPENERDYYLERRYPIFGNLVPRDIASRNAKMICDEGYGVGKSKFAVYLDFRDAIRDSGIPAIKDKYGNLFSMYEKITGENPYERPMRIYPAVHFTMGGLWVDYNLSTNIPGLYVLGEANFADHGSNRLGASALMQGLADGYFIIPYTLDDYLIKNVYSEKVSVQHSAFDDAEKETLNRIHSLLKVKGKKTVLDFHRELGELMWDNVGMSRDKESLEKSIPKIAELREEFWKEVYIPGENHTCNKYLEYALRLADYMELGELMARDALDREESCGSHFRVEYQTKEGEAERDDQNFSHVSCWEYKGEGKTPVKHKEELNFEYVTTIQRVYK